jgi:hypothetical protein
VKPPGFPSANKKDSPCPLRLCVMLPFRYRLFFLLFLSFLFLYHFQFFVPSVPWRLRVMLSFRYRRRNRLFFLPLSSLSSLSFFIIFNSFVTFV